MPALVFWQIKSLTVLFQNSIILYVVVVLSNTANIRKSITFETKPNNSFRTHAYHYILNQYYVKIEAPQERRAANK